MDIIKKYIKRILLTLFILALSYAIFFPVKADDVGETSNHLYANKISGRDSCKNWFCIESNQSVADYFNGYTWKLDKQIVKTSEDGDAWHLMGRIAYWCQLNDKVTFDYKHDVNHNYVSKWSYSNAGQAMMWQLLREYSTSFRSGGLSYSAGPKCRYCNEYTVEDKNKWLKDGWKYTVTIDVWKNISYPSAQKLIHVAVTRKLKIKPVTLDFYKINTAGNGVAGATLGITSNSGITSLSIPDNPTSAADGKIGEVTVTPTTNTGTFKINLTEAAPNGYLGIPNDVVLTVSYDNGSVTRNKRRNSK